MPYTNSKQVEATLAQSLTTGSPGQLSTRAKLVDVGTKVNVNTIPPTEVNFYIAQADSIINAALSQQYAVPLSEKCDLSMSLTSPVSEYTGSIGVDYLGDLNPGDIIVLTNGADQERLIVDTVLDQFTFTTVDFPTYTYGTGSRALRIKFPDPIPYIAARLAAAGP